jgi:DNA-binding transcriptional regulator PaaX
MRENSIPSKVIAFLNEYPGRNNKEIAQGIGTNEEYIRFTLQKMKKKGLILGSNKNGWYTDEELQKRLARKKEIANDVLEECYAIFKISENEKNKIQLARIITDLLKKI